MVYDVDGKNYPWFKMHSKGWLTGTIRATMTPAERSVWADLLAMANESRFRGIICRAKDIPYTNEYLASYLGVSVDLVTSTIDKCMNDKNMRDEQHRIEVDKYGCMYITNWDHYQAKPTNKDKTVWKEQAKAKAQSRQNSLDALRREVNRLNINITDVGKKLRYAVRDGEILDTETGEVVPYSKGSE